jgi:hypothetical protein
MRATNFKYTIAASVAAGFVCYLAYTHTAAARQTQQTAFSVRLIRNMYSGTGELTAQNIRHYARFEDG